MIERIIILGGKGGVGKSSISAATAVALSDLLPEKKILLISFDIAHNLSDMFNKEIGDKLTRLTPNLWGIEPDPDIYAEEYTKEFAKKMKKLIKKMPIVGFIPQIKSFIDTTFTADSIPLALKNAMFFQKILDAEDSIYREGINEIQFDIIVADFPPTGNMVALFDIPEDTVKVLLKYSLNFYNSIKDSLQGFSKMFRKVIHPFEQTSDKEHLSDELVKMLTQLEERGERISDLIHNVGSLRLVTIAEKPSFEEIKRARELTKDYVNLDGVHINMIIPEEHARTCEFCNKVSSLQKKYLTEIEREFTNTKIWESNKLIEEPIGLEGLRRLAREIYGENKANDILFPKE
ncbi:MAG: ArsA family ATPase [Promethearchaeota archaeon]|nr:MAG: ArsA family ATPase [Candidatus Lokiarchaeota archaeon]